MIVVGSLIGGAIGSALYYGARWLCAHAPKNKPKWEPFEPGVCDDLPEHPWLWGHLGGSMCEFICPKCRMGQGAHRPPYCSERGGHFHFKCNACGYEWAMLPADHKPTVAPTGDNYSNTNPATARRPIPGNGVS